jgi:hypothetical protein
VFFPRTTPLSVAPAQVQGLRLSLNTPVVATEELPIGPARAAILVHADPELGPTVTIGIRSLRADRTALYGLEGDPAEGAGLEVAIDAALSFAESMGFLFDEDEIADGSAQAKTRCVGLWRELLGDESGEVGRPPARRAEPEPELLLEDLAEEATEFVLPPPPGKGEGEDPEIGEFLEEDDEDLEADGPQAADGADDAAVEDAEESELPAASDAQLAAEASQAVARSAKRPAGVALTKFRSRGAARPARAPARGAGKAAAKAAAAAGAKAAAESEKGRPTALGRMRLVRRVRDGLRKRNPILRLFGAY